MGKTVELTAYTRGLEFSMKELSEALEKVAYPLPESGATKKQGGTS